METNATKATELRAEASAHEAEREASFERCDTDGFLSQWASGINASLKRRQADLLEAGGMARFPGLYEGDRRVKAKMISTKFGDSWILEASEAEKFGRKFMPVNYENTSKVHKKHGLQQRREMAPARAAIMGSGRGLSGCANAFVGCYRTGDQWGQDATLCPEGPENLGD